MQQMKMEEIFILLYWMKRVKQSKKKFQYLNKMHKIICLISIHSQMVMLAIICVEKSDADKFKTFTGAVREDYEDENINN